MNPSSRRTQQRIPVLIPAGIRRVDHPKELIEAEITNISLGGCFVQCKAPVTLRQELVIEIRFAEGQILPATVTEEGEDVPVPPDNESAVTLVRWMKTDARAGFGVEFRQLQPETRQYLLRLLNYFEKLTRAGVSF